ncbi:hypothetical protein [Halomonas jincaotanensis]|uniref:hypothetical protein n=1 Tax=Halomonas jincaotanensis TaxID=2810616 RepID=UPI001BD625E9|nr:hypothetical protein [Halomonas jincaotanensis]
MNRHHYMKKYAWEAVNRVCVLIIVIVPFAHLLVEGTSMLRAFIFIGIALIGLLISIKQQAELEEKEPSKRH